MELPVEYVWIAIYFDYEQKLCRPAVYRSKRLANRGKRSWMKICPLGRCSINKVIIRT